MNRLLALSMVVIFGCALPGIAAADDTKPAKTDDAKPAKPRVNYFGGGSSAKTPPKHATNTRASFSVVGTDCYTCFKRMKRKLQDVKGVKHVHIMSWEPYEAFVSYDSTVTSWPEIAASIADEKVQLLNVKIEPLLPKTK